MSGPTPGPQLRTQSTPCILITGATDGIGLALARYYAGRRARLLLVGRRSAAELDDPLFSPATYCRADLALPDCDRVVAAWLEAQGVERIDLLIHNAGLGYVGPVATQPPDDIRRLFAVNLVAPVALTHRLAPLVERAAGTIAFISSVASVLPGPEYAVYTATKAALDGFVRNLRIELAAQQSNITLTLIHPGATRTGMHRKAGLDPARTDWTRFPPAEQVAEAIARAAARAPRRVAVGAANRIALGTGLLLPGTIDRLMRGRTRTAPSLPVRADNARHCIITGAADGIGRALALRLASAGYTVTGVDVDRARARQTEEELCASGAAATFLQADLSDPGAVATLVEELRSRPEANLLIHNAGINATGSFLAMDLDRQLAVLRVNLLAPMLLTAGLLRHARLLQHGDLVCLASLSTYVGYPGAAAYAASKDGLASYARSLGLALSSEEINVLTVFPGPTRTAHARRHSPDNRREENRMPPEELADRIVRAVERRKTKLVPGLGNKGFMLAGRLAPRLTEAAMRRTIFDKLIATQSR